MAETQQQIDGRKSVMLRQSEAEYVTVSPETGTRQCANCRFFCPAGTWIEGNQISVSTCVLVENYPLSILATGFCNRHELIPPDANEVAPMQVVIVEDDMERGYIAPLPVKVNPLKRFFGAKPPPEVTITRGDDGLRKAIIFTSNGYEDRESEHVATKALQEYVESQFKDGVFRGDNKLLFWHTFDIGDIVAPLVIDGFLVEVAKERSGSPLAKIAWDYWEKTTLDGSVVWGASHGFKAAREGDTYVRIRKYETSVLPVEAAANLYTYSEVLPMTADYEKHMDTMLGMDGAAKILRDKGPAALNEELRKRGKVAKSNDKPEPPAPAPGAVIDWTPLFSQLIDAADEHQKTIDAQAQEITALKSAAETRQKAADGVAQELAAVRKDVEALRKALSDFKADTPRRASEDQATRLSGEDEKKAREEIEKRTTEYDSAFGDMKVPLKKGAN